MRKTDSCHHSFISFPNPRKRQKVSPVQNKKPLPAAGGRGKKSLPREDTAGYSPVFLHFSSRCRILQNVPLCSFSYFSSFRTAAVNMRSTPDTNQPPLIITGATKQENKYRREERRDEGWKRGSLCRVSGAVKWLDAA